MKDRSSIITIIWLVPTLIVFYLIIPFFIFLYFDNFLIFILGAKSGPIVFGPIFSFLAAIAFFFVALFTGNTIWNKWRENHG